MDKFEIGEAAVGQNHVNYTSLNGAECIIVGGLEGRHTIDRTTREVNLNNATYLVKWANGETTATRPKYLKKKKPPEEASWEEIQRTVGWNPTKIEVTE